MKAIKKETLKTFHPIEITLTIESEDELLDLFHRVNLTPSVVREEAKKSTHRIPAAFLHTNMLFHILVAEINKLEA